MKQQLVRCQAIAIYFSAYKLLDSMPPAQLTRLHLTVSVRPITVISLNYFHIFSQLYVILKSVKKSEQLLIVSFHDLFDFICSRKCILEKSILEMSKQIADDVTYRDRMHALFRNIWNDNDVGLYSGQYTIGAVSVLCSLSLSDFFFFFACYLISTYIYL